MQTKTDDLILNCKNRAKYEAQKDFEAHAQDCLEEMFDGELASDDFHYQPPRIPRDTWNDEGEGSNLDRFADRQYRI